jgi:isoamylase
MQMAKRKQEKVTQAQETRVGRAFPLGATPDTDGVNFSIFSYHSTAMDLLLFDSPDNAEPAQVIHLDPDRNRSFYYWHVYVPGLKSGQVYAYRASGPFDPERGMRFDNQKLLIDPYGRAVAFPQNYDRGSAALSGDNSAVAMKSVVVDVRAYDWEGDAPLHRPFAKTAIYEMHVGGFTRHPNSGVSPEKRGTFAGLIEKIPYLQDLGITTVELMPVYQFDPQDCPSGMNNYWGYSPVSFFAPHHEYCSCKDPLGAIDEFRDMVKALHKAGIEVILDVVYNHTAEGNHQGPTFSFKGLDASVYYILEQDRTFFANYTGTGNTLNANESIVRRLILDSLRYWVRVMHVDGFRFDLASILSRDEAGRPLQNPPILWDIETDPVLVNTKFIAEAWDAAGLYQVGTFVGERWKEWNGRFRDDVRSFMKADRDTAGKIASRLLASPDIYAHEEREPDQSINFITCHDGFTLNDLVSYNEKHNQANGENNRDGSNNNLSWNCGAEGSSADPHVEELRNRQVKNFLAVTLLSIGAPMLLMGDEVRRTQRGNNNAYCQDNEISWFDWGLLDQHADVHRFVRGLIRLRFEAMREFTDLNLTLNELLQQAKIHWHGVSLNQPDWSPDSHTLALCVESRGGHFWFHLILNAYWEALEFELPGLPAGANSGWRRILDTSLTSPQDILELSAAPLEESGSYLAQPHSVVGLVAQVH